MGDLAILLVAVLLILVGARGTYASIWNKLFPNMTITPGPATSIPAIATVQSIAQQANNLASNPAYNPVASGQQAGTTVRKAVGTAISSLAGNTSNPAHVVSAPGGAYKQTTVTPEKETVVNTGIPSWWPSWLPWPGNLVGYYPGEGQTGQIINTP